MRNIILPAALAAFALTIAPQVHAAEHSGLYVNAGLGRSHATANASSLNGSRNTTGGIFNIGWRQTFIGFEAGYTDLGSVHLDDPMSGNERLSAHGYTAGINVHFNVTDHFYIGGRAGTFFWRMTDHWKSYFGNPPATDKSHLSSTNWYSGLSAGYDIDRHWSVGGEFNYYRMSKGRLTVNDRMYTATVEYRF